MFNSLQCQPIYLNNFAFKIKIILKSVYVLTILPHKYPQDQTPNHTCLLTNLEQVHKVSMFPFSQRDHMKGEGKAVTRPHISFKNISI